MRSHCLPAFQKSEVFIADCHAGRAFNSVALQIPRIKRVSDYAYGDASARSDIVAVWTICFDGMIGAEANMKCDIHSTS